jgi:Ca2+-binding RTX toxin-like protein
MASTRRLVLITGLAAISVFALPAAANAAVTCTFNSGTGAMVVDITAGDVTAEVRNNAGAIEVLNGSLALQTCSPDTPTTANTTSITMNDTVAGQNSLFLFDLDGGPLGPGTPVEGSGTSEIEVTINAGDGLADRLQLIGTSSADTFRFGTLASGTGANLNNDDDSDDITFNNGDRLTVSPGSSGADTLDASGGTEFTGPLPYDAPGSSAVVLRGGSENDVLRAGSGSSLLDGGANDDQMTGGAGGDEIELGTAGGNDIADGAGGTDFANFQFSPVGALAVDLRVAGPQDTGVAGTDTLSNFENLAGSQQSLGSDTLIGTNGPNRIVANAGDDTLIGLGGDDVLEGGLGTDTASYAQGSTGAVFINLGTVTPQPTVGAGTDTLPDISPSDGFSDIENLIGSPFGGDFLTGDAHANQIDAYDGVADAVFCIASGDGDVAIADEVGVDSLSACETADTAPQTSIASGPAAGATVATRTPTYGLSADEPSTFQVKVDSGSFQACAASCTVPSLADGSHTIAFRAIDSDENFHADLNPATRAVTVAVAPPGTTPPADTTAPETTIGSHPKPKTKKRRAIFTFTSSEAGSTFLCSVDGAPFAPCTSPFTTPKRKKGKHRFDVLATDSAGNRDQSAATFFWKVLKRRKH